MSIGPPWAPVPGSEEEMTECRAEMVLKEASEPWEPRLEFSPGLAGAAGQRVHPLGSWPARLAWRQQHHLVQPQRVELLPPVDAAQPQEVEDYGQRYDQDAGEEEIVVVDEGEAQP